MLVSLVRGPWIHLWGLNEGLRCRREMLAVSSVGSKCEGARDASSVSMYSTEERDDASTMTTAVGAELEGPSVGSKGGVIGGSNE